MNCWTVCVSTLLPNNNSSSVNSADRMRSGQLSGCDSRLAASNPISVALFIINLFDRLGVMEVSINARLNLEMNSGKGNSVICTLLAFSMGCSIAGQPNASADMQGPSFMTCSLLPACCSL